MELENKEEKEDGNLEDKGAKLQWRLLSELLSGREHDELFIVPKSVQEVFEAEKKELEKEIQRLAEESAGSRDAFDKYRGRAKKSLQDASALQRELEAQCSDKERMLAEAESKRMRLEKELSRAEQRCHDTNEELRAAMLRHLHEKEEAARELTDLQQRVEELNHVLAEQCAQEENRREEDKKEVPLQSCSFNLFIGMQTLTFYLCLVM